MRRPASAPDWASLRQLRSEIRTSALFSAASNIPEKRRFDLIESERCLCFSASEIPESGENEKVAAIPGPAAWP